MEGAALAAERNHEREMLVAHQGAAWLAAASAGKLKPFSHYRKQSEEEQGTPQQSNEQILSALMVLQNLGAPMSIEEVN